MYYKIKLWGESLDSSSSWLVYLLFPVLWLVAMYFTAFITPSLFIWRISLFVILSHFLQFTVVLRFLLKLI